MKQVKSLCYQRFNLWLRQTGEETQKTGEGEKEEKTMFMSFGRFILNQMLRWTKWAHKNLEYDTSISNSLMN